MYEIGDEVYCIPDLVTEFEPIQGTIVVSMDYMDDDDIRVNRTSNKCKSIISNADNIFYSKEFCQEAIKLKIQLNAIKNADIGLRKQKTNK